MMTEIESVTEASLSAALAETPGPLIVDFGADWCGPCQVMEPILERLAREHPEVRVVKVDVDDEPGLAAAVGVYGVPTLIRFDGGQETTRIPGALPYEELTPALGIDPGAGSIAARRPGPPAASSRGRSSRREPGWRRGIRRSA